MLITLANADHVATIVGELVDALKGGEILVPLASLVIFVLLNKQYIEWYDFGVKIRNRRIEQLKAGVQAADDDTTRSVLSDLLDARLLEREIGIYAERDLRSALLDLHDRAGGEVTWRQIREARSYLTVRHGDLYMSVGKGAKWAYCGNYVFSIVSLLIAGALLLLAMYLVDGSAGVAAVSALYALFFFGLGA